MSTVEKLPPGSIVRRVIRGKERFYHQWREDGKTKSRYLKPHEVLPLREAIEKRKMQEKRRKAVNSNRRIGDCPQFEGDCPLFRTGVVTGRRIPELVAEVRRWEKRESFAELSQWLQGEGPLAKAKAVVIYGQPGVGKTTLLRQGLLALGDAGRREAAYLSVPIGLPAAELFDDLHRLTDRSIRFVFIDGIDRSAGIVAAVPALADTFGALGVKLVLARTETGSDAARADYPPGGAIGTISLTPLSFRDFTTLSGTRDLASYLRNGGPLTAGLGPDADDALAALARSALIGTLADWPRLHNRRADVRIGNDISKIARRLEDEVAASAPTDPAEVERLRRLEIVGASEDERFIALPALAYETCSRIVNGLLDDPVSAHLGAAERKIVRDAIMHDVTERILADQILLETIRRRTGDAVSVFRIRFASGRFDVAVTDRDELTCELYKVVLSDERGGRELMDLTDRRKLDTVEHRYGTIIAREVIYLGRTARHGSGVTYRAAADYLLGGN